MLLARGHRFEASWPCDSGVCARVCARECCGGVVSHQFHERVRERRMPELGSWGIFAPRKKRIQSIASPARACENANPKRRGTATTARSGPHARWPPLSDRAQAKTRRRHGHGRGQARPARGRPTGAQTPLPRPRLLPHDPAPHAARPLPRPRDTTRLLPPPPACGARRRPQAAPPSRRPTRPLAPAAACRPTWRPRPQ